MAGDWIKVEEAMPDKTEVCQIAHGLRLDPDAVVGKLIRVWVWASRNCHADGVTNVTAMLAIDRAAGVTGFAHAMVSAGWLIVEGDEMRFPNFCRHNTKTAKDRALAAKRQDARRHAHVTKMSRSQRDNSVTREEKRREELNTNILLTKNVSSEASKTPSEPSILAMLCTSGKEFGITQSHVTAWTEAFPAVDVLAECRKAIAWIEANPSKRKTIKGAPRFLVAWLTRTQDRGGNKPPPQGQHAANDRQAEMRRRQQLMLEHLGGGNVDTS